MKRISWDYVMRSDKLQNGELRAFFADDRVSMGPIDTITVDDTHIILRCTWMVESLDGGESFYSIDTTEVKIPRKTAPLWFEELNAALIDDFSASGAVFRLSPEHTTIRITEEPDNRARHSPLCGND